MRDIKKIWLTLIALLIIIVLPSKTLAITEEHDDELFHPKQIKSGMTLSMIDCVATAYKNSPYIKKAKYNLDIVKSNVGIAKSRYFPVISANAGFYHENNSNHNYYNSYYRQLPSVGVAINKMVWDFGKTTAYIKMEKFYQLGAEYEFMDSLCDTLFDIKHKYYNLLKSKANLDIAQRDVELSEHLLEISKKIPDNPTAQVYLNEAKLTLESAKNSYNNAKLNLSNSMYLDEEINFNIENTKTFNFDDDYDYKTEKLVTHNFVPQEYTFPMEKAVQIAYDNSPDLNILISTEKAMEESLKYIKKTYFPELSANVGYGFLNTNETSNNSLQVGANLTSSVNLMELKHSIKGANAQINLANTEITLFKKDLYYELKRAFNNVDTSKNQVYIAQDNAEQAKNNLKIVENKYLNNDVDYIALQDSKQNYIDSLHKYIDSLYNYNIALIQVEMAMHYHIIDIHHKSEHAMHYHSAELINHLNEVLGCDEKDTKKKRK